MNDLPWKSIELESDRVRMVQLQNALLPSIGRRIAESSNQPQTRDELITFARRLENVDKMYASRDASRTNPQKNDQKQFNPRFDKEKDNS